MKRYEYKITIDFYDESSPDKVIQYFRDVVYPGHEIMMEGESVFSLEYTEVPIPELPT
jgi:hypothetical protein